MPTRDGRKRFMRTGTCLIGYVGKGEKMRAGASRDVACVFQDRRQSLPIRQIPQW